MSGLCYDREGEEIRAGMGKKSSAGSKVDRTCTIFAMALAILGYSWCDT
jgi:hypothetical protein